MVWQTVSVRARGEEGVLFTLMYLHSLTKFFSLSIFHVSMQCVMLAGSCFKFRYTFT